MTDYTKKIKEVIAEKAGVDPSEVDESLYFEDDLNLSSLEMIEILHELEEVLHIELVEHKENLETVQDLVDMVTEQVE